MILFFSLKDIYIHRFFRYCHQAEGRLQTSSSVRGNENSSLEGLCKSIKDLEKAQEEPLIRFLHLIIDKLLMLLVRPPMAASSVGKDVVLIFNVAHALSLCLFQMLLNHRGNGIHRSITPFRNSTLHE